MIGHIHVKLKYNPFIFWINYCTQIMHLCCLLLHYVCVNVIIMYFFIFRTELALCTLKDVYIIEKDDIISGMHSCPVYISPESLQPGSLYSGKASNVWILGVMLYTILVGRHPFTHTNLTGLYKRIQKCKFNLPELLSPKAKCLICSILRPDPAERLTAEEILSHPWFSSTSYSQYMWTKMFYKEKDQEVPSL